MLNGEIFYTLKNANVLFERWKWHYKHNQAAGRSWLQTSGTRDSLAHRARFS